MDFRTFIYFLPFLGAFYGVSIGVYSRSKSKTPKKKAALIISGILLVIVCVAVLYYAFSK